MDHINLSSHASGGSTISSQHTAVKLLCFEGACSKPDTDGPQKIRAGIFGSRSRLRRRSLQRSPGFATGKRDSEWCTSSLLTYQSRIRLVSGRYFDHLAANPQNLSLAVAISTEILIEGPRDPSVTLVYGGKQKFSRIPRTISVILKNE